MPPALRRDWQQEWEAEVEARVLLLLKWRRLNWREKARLMRRSLGTFRDAIYLLPRRLEDELIQDLRFGIRMLITKPSFSVVAVITLSLGIGATTAIFSIVDTTLLRPLPFKDSQELVMVRSTNQKRGIELGELSLDDYLDVRDRNEVFAELATFGPYGFNITDGQAAEKITAVVVSSNLFKTLGVEAALGRTFVAEDSPVEPNNVVLMSHSLWQRRFGADPNILTKTVSLDGQPYTVVGIMPAGFHFPNDDVEMWAPMTLIREEGSRSIRWLNVIGRLKTGASINQSKSQLNVIASQLEAQYSDSNKGWGLEVLPLHEISVRDVRFALLLLFAAVAVVLLIACVNVANLSLSRIDSRQRELAVRSALGAGRRRLIRQLLTENILLYSFSCASGVMLAVLALKALTGWIPLSVVSSPDTLSLLKLGQPHLDFRVFGFAALLSLVTGVSFGLVPIYRVARFNVGNFLKEGGRNIGSSSGSRIRSALVVTEVALTLVLLAGSGLLIRSFARLLQEDPGFKSDGLLTFQISPASKYRRPAERLNFYQQLTERLSNLPGVESVGATTTLPFSGTDMNSAFTIVGRGDFDSTDRPTARFHSVTSGYLRTMRIPIVAGRCFSERDDSQSPKVVLINETLARLYFSGANPIGQRMIVTFAGEKPMEIIGVVGNTRQMGLDATIKPEVYMAANQRVWSFMTFAVRTNVDPMLLANAVRGQVAELDKDIPVYKFAPMDQRVADSIASRRFNMLLTSVFAVLSLLLAAVGIYGVISYSVSQRTHEIGLRIALGAQRRDIFRLMIGKAMLLAAAGSVFGLAGALAIGRLLSSLLFGVSSSDTTTFIAVSALLFGVALLAAYIPARRAAKLSPLAALNTPAR